MCYQHINNLFCKLVRFKVFFFFITSFISSKKDVKQVILINHSWISLTLQRDEGWSFVHSPNKSAGGQIFLQKRQKFLK